MLISSKKILLHTLSWLLFFSIIALILFLQHGNVRTSLFRKLLPGILFFYINYLVLIPRFLFRKEKVLYILSSLAVILTLFFLPFLVHLFWGIRLYKTPNFSRGHFWGLLFIHLFFFASALALRIYEKWQDNEQRTQNIYTQKVAAELHNLKNQINPHFLFNSLNSIYALTVKQSAQAPEAVITLSELMRYMLYETTQKFVALEKEIGYIQNYIKLQRLRMTDGSGVQLMVTGNENGLKIAPLLLINFIENAFKYGTDHTGQMRIEIQLQIADKSLFFLCKNTLADRQKTIRNSGNGIGLRNTKERLQLLYPKKHDLKITQTETEYIVTLSLDLL